MTYYEILEVNENASKEVIHMAYKALCKKYHPDVYCGDKDFAEEQIKKINEAYTTLSNDTKKVVYDNTIKNKRNNSNRNYSDNNKENNKTNIDILLKRGFFAIEDGEWTIANNFFEQALNQDAELAEAYLGKLMIELKVPTKLDLKNYSIPFDNRINYKRAMRFADSSLKSFLVETINFINKRNYEIECESKYSSACELLKQKGSIKCIEEALSIFKEISNYRDSYLKIQECEAKIQEFKEEIARKKELEEEHEKTTIRFTALFCIAFLCLFIAAIFLIPKNNYDKAMLLIEEQKYTEAVTILKTINGYKDSVKYINYCNEKINESNYEKALELIEENNFIDAHALLKESSLTGHIGSKIIMEKYQKEFDIAIFNDTLKNGEIGTVVTFGSYEQDDNLENGKESVNWIIIDRNETSAMLISEKILDCQPYRDSYSDSITWETCSLRKWLNGPFFNTIFNDTEKQRIPKNKVIPDPKLYSTSRDPGKETFDRVFLLSENEYNEYEFIDGVRYPSCTKHAFAINDRSDISSWWLRSTDDEDYHYSEIVNSGNVYSSYESNTDGIRPVICVNFE